MKRVLPIILTVSLALGFVAQGQQQIFDQVSLKERGALSEVQATELRRRQELIIDEVAKIPEDEWVGKYFSEDGPTSGTQLHWAPGNGFVVWWSTCSYGWRDRINFGEVSLHDGLLHLAPTLRGEGQKLYAVSPDLVPIKWGEQHYLVPSDQIIAFCYAVLNSGRSLEIGEFFLKESDREKRRFGLPRVPPSYKKYLLGKPIQAAIIELKSQSHPLHKSLILNAGRKAGMVPGMKLFAVSPANVYMLVEVIAVTDLTSEVFVITSGFKNRSEKSVIARVGWKFTSRAPKEAYKYYPS